MRAEQRLTPPTFQRIYRCIFGIKSIKIKVRAMTRSLPIIAFGLLYTFTAYAQLSANSNKSISANSYSSSSSNSASAKVPSSELYTIKVSFSNQESSPKGKSVLKFQSLLETRSGGRVKVQVHPFSKLLKEQNEFEALQLGITDIIIPNTSKVANDLGIDEYQMFDLPFLFTGREAFSKFLKSDTNAQLLKRVNEKNKLLTAVTFWGNGLRGISSQKPIVKLEDFKGLTIALQYSEPSVRSFQLLGAQSVKIAESDLNQGFVRKIGDKRIDASDNTMSNFNFYNLYEHQKYFVNTGHAYSVYVVLANEKKLKTLPEDIQKMVIQTLEDVQTYHQEIADEDNLKSAAIAKDNKVAVLEFNDNDKKNLRDRLIPVHEAFVREHKELMTKVYEALK